MKNTSWQRKGVFRFVRSKTYSFIYSLNGCASVNDWSASAIRNNSLYLATRSVRDSDPVLIWPQPRPTAKWLIVVSSVSPERWLMTVRQPAFCAILTAWIVLVSEPIWFGLTSSALAVCSAIARSISEVFVTSKSSPTSWMRSPSRSRSSFQPSQSFSTNLWARAFAGYYKEFYLFFEWRIEVV